MTIKRRAFLHRLSAGTLAVAAPPRLFSPSSFRSARTEVLESWLDGLSGRHKQFFDAPLLDDGAPLVRTATFLDIYREAYGLKDAEINVVFGAHRAGLAFVFSDQIWSKFGLGKHFSVVDDSTGLPATRNKFAPAVVAATPSVTSLQQRGVRFIACMQSMQRLSRTLAPRVGAADSAVYQELVAGLVPGVIAVPAMIVATNRAQEFGLTYAYLG